MLSLAAEASGRKGIWPRLEPSCAHGFAAISPREVERTREGTEEHLVWEKRTRRTGLCSWSDYYVARPEQRAITESYSETVFELRPAQVMVSWQPSGIAAFSLLGVNIDGKARLLALSGPYAH